VSPRHRHAGLALSRLQAGGKSWDEPVCKMYLSDIYTITGSTGRNPCMSVPCGKTAGRPAGGNADPGPALYTNPACSRLADAFERAAASKVNIPR